MSKAKYEGPAAKLERYEALLASVDGVERKGAANPYTSRNGHMTSFIDREGVVSIRLDKEDRDAFMEEYDTDLASPVRVHDEGVRGRPRWSAGSAGSVEELVRSRLGLGRNSEAEIGSEVGRRLWKRILRFGGGGGCFCPGSNVCSGYGYADM